MILFSCNWESVGYSCFHKMHDFITDLFMALCLKFCNFKYEIVVFIFLKQFSYAR